MSRYVLHSTIYIRVNSELYSCAYPKLLHLLSFDDDNIVHTATYTVLLKL
jgi:hypothetical protein